MPLVSYLMSSVYAGMCHIHASYVAVRLLVWPAGNNFMHRARKCTKVC